jgi:hypothetical protein
MLGFLYVFGVFFGFYVGVWMVAKKGHIREVSRYERGYTWLAKTSAHSQHV